MRGFVALELLLAVSMYSAPAFAASAVLSWTDNSTNESTFDVERKTEPCSGTGSFSSLASTNANVATLIDGSVEEGKEYCYRVRASNAAGSSPYSNTAGVLIPLTVPGAPSGLVATPGK